MKPEPPPELRCNPDQHADAHRYQRMANTLPVMLYDSTIGADGVDRFLYVAPQPCREILELDPEALLADMSLVLALIHPDDLADFQSKSLEAYRENLDFLAEVRIITPSGRLKWLLVNSKPNPAEPGEPVVWSGYLQDITQRKRTEERLRATEETLRLIVENSTSLFYIHDTEHVLTYVSPQSRTFFDCEPEEAMVRWTELVTDHPVNAEGLEATRRSIETAERQPPYELECIGRKGRKLWVEVTEAPIVEEGRTVAIAGTLTDITKRKQAEREREQYVKFFRTSADLMCIADPHGFFLKVNPAFTAALGYSEEELLSKPLVDFIHPDDRQATLNEIARQKETGFTDNFENRYRCIDGSLRSLSWRVTFDREEGRAYATARDITEQKSLQEQLAQAQKIESLGRLAGGVAHDFNNMLSVILGHTDMALLKEPVDSTQRVHLTQVQKAAERSAEIVSQLLAFARKQPIRPEVLELDTSLPDTLTMLRRLIGEEIELDWQPAPVWPVQVDAAQIGQMLANLCINARDAIPGSGKISIAISNTSVDAAQSARNMGLNSGDYVLLTVRDNGCGMDRQILDRIFEPFFTTKEVGQGTGLGLAMVYGIVKQHGGFIEVQSRPGSGTEFHIYLPRFEGGDQVTAPKTEPTMVGGDETILLVEDEDDILAIVRMLLEQQGYRVLAAATPGEALDLAERHSGAIDLLITDVIMPEMNGRELTDRITRRNPGLRCLYMSGYSDDIVSRQGIIDEGLNFLRKPFGSELLATRVREILDTPAN